MGVRKRYISDMLPACGVQYGESVTVLSCSASQLSPCGVFSFWLQVFGSVRILVTPRPCGTSANIGFLLMHRALHHCHFVSTFPSTVRLSIGSVALGRSPVRLLLMDTFPATSVRTTDFGWSHSRLYRPLFSLLQVSFGISWRLKSVSVALGRLPALWISFLFWSFHGSQAWSCPSFPV